MVKRLVHHASRHSIAYVALVCSLLALGGASYAAFRIPNGAVGERQIKNHVIDPVKWDPTYVTAFFRRWAHVDATGHLITASSFAQSAVLGQTGSYDVTWGDAFSGRCQPFVTVQGGVPVPAVSGGSGGSGSGTGSTTTTTGTTTTTPTPTPTTVPSAGFATANVVTQPHNATVVNVTTFNQQGQAAPEPFYLGVACPPGAGGGQTFPYTLP
jgi:hypothetical protein